MHLDSSPKTGSQAFPRRVLWTRQVIPAVLEFTQPPSPTRYDIVTASFNLKIQFESDPEIWNNLLENLKIQVFNIENLLLPGGDFQIQQIFWSFAGLFWSHPNTLILIDVAFIIS